MDATIVPEVQKHYPVLLKEIISIISPQYGGTFIDCTFGQGGYSKKILEFENTKVIALDRDIESEVKANQLKDKFDDMIRSQGYVSKEEFEALETIAQRLESRLDKLEAKIK